MPNQPKSAVVRDQPKKMSRAVMSVAGATTWPSTFKSGGSSCSTLGAGPSGRGRVSVWSLDSSRGAIGLSVVRRAAVRAGTTGVGALDSRRGVGRGGALDVCRRLEPVGSVAFLLRLGEHRDRRPSRGSVSRVVTLEAGAIAVLEVHAEVVAAACP